MEKENYVIRVNNVSKVYRLWSSPRDRLLQPLKRIITSFLPPILKRKVKYKNYYHDFHALHDISFDIKKGDSWGFVGVNGSGKSTLLKIISGNLRPSTGSVEVEGKVAILDYGSGFNIDFTGRENIFLKGTLMGLNKKELEDRFRSIEEFADIGEFINQPIKTYSSGMSARLGFSIMAHVDADIMITDEALAVGDAFFVQKCMRYIKSFLNQGTFLFVSHSINDVMALCDHAVWLEKGRAVCIGKAKEVCMAYLNSIERKNSEEYLAEDKQNERIEIISENVNNKEENKIIEKEVLRPSKKQINVSANTLAKLKNHYAPTIALERFKTDIHSIIHVKESDKFFPDDILLKTAVGGGKIFSVNITDEYGKALSTILGGEIVCISIRAIAERKIKNPIIGFQLLNYMGLALFAENTYLTTHEKEIELYSGEIITAKFNFVMPLLNIGEYVIRTGFADGVEDNNALMDVINEALLLRCETMGARHGLVCVPMISIIVERDHPPDLEDEVYEFNQKTKTA